MIHQTFSIKTPWTSNVTLDCSTSFNYARLRFSLFFCASLKIRNFVERVEIIVEIIHCHFLFNKPNILADGKKRRKIYHLKNIFIWLIFFLSSRATLFRCCPKGDVVGAQLTVDYCGVNNNKQLMMQRGVSKLRSGI